MAETLKLLKLSFWQKGAVNKVMHFVYPGSQRLESAKLSKPLKLSLISELLKLAITT